MSDGMQPIDTRRKPGRPKDCLGCLHYPYGEGCIGCPRSWERAEHRRGNHPPVGLSDDINEPVS